MPKVLISIPTLGKVHTLLADRLVSWTVNQNYQKQFYFTVNVSPVDRAREEIVDAFLKTECTHLFMVDSDTIPPVDAIERLLAMDVPVATGITAMVRFDKDKRAEDVRQNYYSEYNVVGLDSKNVKANVGIVEAIGAGGSCLLIRRDVVEGMKRPLFRNVYGDDNGKQQFISEDIYFVTKARQSGFKTFADTSVICWHYKEIVF